MQFLKRLNSVTTRVYVGTRGASSTTIKHSFTIKRVNRSLSARKYEASTGMQHDTELTKTTWDPLQIFHRPAHFKYAVVILNCPLNWKHDVVLKIWEQAQTTVTVDGGTHQWLKYLEEQGINVLEGGHTAYVPDLITGDMDSSSPLVLEKLKAMGSIIVETPDQSHTDYTKALLQLGQYIKMENINLNGIYVFAETSGRFDHITGNINTLYKSDKYVGSIPVIQVASNSLTWMLKPGLHSIKIPEILVQKRSWCGLLPFGSPVHHITTTGLKWNLHDGSMQFGGLVSTSNTYNDTEVTINTESPIIWTMGIEPFGDDLNNCIES